MGHLLLLDVLWRLTNNCRRITATYWCGTGLYRRMNVIDIRTEGLSVGLNSEAKELQTEAGDQLSLTLICCHK